MDRTVCADRGAADRNRKLYPAESGADEGTECGYLELHSFSDPRSPGLCTLGKRGARPGNHSWTFHCSTVRRAGDRT